MTTKDQLQALSLALGWTEIDNVTGINPEDCLKDFLPSFHNNLNLLAEARNKLINSTELRVKWVNTLRTIVASKYPKNKVGNSLVSDVDLLFAEAPELLEALVKTMNKWEK